MSLSSRRLVAEAAAVAAAVAAGHYLFRWTGAFLFGAFDDDGVYVVLGKAIAQGLGYRSIHLVAAPLQVRFPPGLPLLLAVPWSLGGSLQAVRVVVGVMQPIVTGGAAGLIWAFGRRHLNLGAPALAVCAVSPLLLEPTIQLFNLPLSEPYFVLGWIAALMLGQRLIESPASPRTSVSRGLGTGLALAATALTRTAGLALIPGILLALALHRRRAAVAACALGSLAPLGAWWALRQTWIGHETLSSLPDDLGYWRWLGFDGGPLAVAGYGIRAVIPHTLAYAHMLASFLWAGNALGYLVVAAAAGMAGFACFRLWKTQAALVLTVLFAAVLTVLWPYGQDRLLLPLLPFFGLLAASTADAAMRHAPPRLSTPVFVALGVVALAATLRQSDLRESAVLALVGAAPRDATLSPTFSLARRSRFIQEVAHWAHDHTRPEDRLMVDAGAGVYLYSGRRTVAAEPTESRLGPSAFAVPGRYLSERILVDSLAVVVLPPATPALERDVATVLARCPGVLDRDPASPPVPIYYRVHRDDACLQTLLGSQPR